MRTRLPTPILALTVALVACTAEAPREQGADEGAREPAATAGDGPAGEIPAATRTPVDAPGATPTPPTTPPTLPEGVGEEWADFYRHIPFVFGSEAGLAQAAETGKPMMMLYAATWCSFCKELAAEALSDPKVVAAIRKDFVPVLLDFDTESAWKERHGVGSTPMIQWTDSAGDVIATTEDALPAERVLEDIATTLEYLADEDGAE